MKTVYSTGNVAGVENFHSDVKLFCRFLQLAGFEKFLQRKQNVSYQFFLNFYLRKRKKRNYDSIDFQVFVLYSYLINVCEM